jgi:hypothetical protein
MENVLKLYRCLTGPDDARFCHRVSAALNNGWILHAGPTLAYDQETKRVICGLAVTKDIEGKNYTSDLDLAKL